MKPVMPYSILYKPTARSIIKIYRHNQFTLEISPQNNTPTKKQSTFSMKNIHLPMNDKRISCQRALCFQNIEAANQLTSTDVLTGVHMLI